MGQSGPTVGPRARSGLGAARLSIVVEWANTRLNGQARAARLFETLDQQWQELRRGDYPKTLSAESQAFLDALDPHPELLVVSSEALPSAVEDSVRRRLSPSFQVVVHVAEGLGYYPLKNVGAARATGQLLLFVDSDVLPDRGWLAHLLAAFARPDVDVVCGQTYVAPTDLFSRAFALGWTYRLPDRSRPLFQPRKFYANTIAFRAEVFRPTGFPPIGNRTRGAASLLGQELGRRGIAVWVSPQACVDHPPPSSFRHMAVRALAHGRDQYMKHSEQRHIGGLVRSVSIATARLGRGCYRTARDWRRVGLRPWQVPMALADLLLLSRLLRARRAVDARQSGGHGPPVPGVSITVNTRSRIAALTETLEHCRVFARFPRALKRFAGRRLTLDDARQIVRERMDRREENFLRVVERGIYAHASSPYLPLLRMAGCELGDLRALVRTRGLEGALRELRAAGVYITFEEFKGRAPIVRNGMTIPVKSRDFDNPCARRDFTLQTGGSTGIATSVNQDLDHLAATAPYTLLMLHAHKTLGAPIACWRAFFPDTALRGILERSYCGQTTERWFSPLGWRDSKYWLRYGLATRYMMFWMRRHGIHVPSPEVVRLDDARVVARWAHDAARRHGRALLSAAVSRALRVCLAAEEAGLDLTGVVFRVGGEPMTPAKAAIMRRAGARYVPSYSMTEARSIARGCVEPAHLGDLHLIHDAYALLTFPHAIGALGLTVPAFNLTALLDTAPKVLLNVQGDDYGVVEERSCGCELERWGYSTHLRDIRSYSKLVGEGVTLIGNEMQRVLESVLPARFGGTVLDYQLLEEEDANGFTRLYLLISPRVRIASEAEVVDVVLRSLAEGSSSMAQGAMTDAAGIVWRQARSLEIRRANPVSTDRGKVLPLRVEHRTYTS